MSHRAAAYYVAFGPHGPRTPVSPPGQGLKVFLYTMGLVGVAGLISLGVRSRGMCFLARARTLFLALTFFLSVAPPPPKTLTREWQEASNERGREQHLDPITGTCPRPIVAPILMRVPTRYLVARIHW